MDGRHGLLVELVTIPLALDQRRLGQRFAAEMIAGGVCLCGKGVIALVATEDRKHGNSLRKLWITVTKVGNLSAHKRTQALARTFQKFNVFPRG